LLGFSPAWREPRRRHRRDHVVDVPRRVSVAAHAVARGRRRRLPAHRARDPPARADFRRRTSAR
jgi:hypothetical protein